jgi:tetraacyldisaccharide 4'-kinase
MTRENDVLMMWKLNDSIRRIWYTSHRHAALNPLIVLLNGLSLPYRLFVGLRNWMYDAGILKQKKLSCRVISVGNITVGGTGKTPTVIMIANLLREKGYRPAVLSRGYGGKTNAPVNKVSDKSGIRMGYVEAGDEPVLIAKSSKGIPVLVGTDRYLTGRAAIAEMDADILILDDAFQHRKLFRDVDIVLLNREKPFGNGCMLPRGPLREPAGSLTRADLIIWKDQAGNGRYPHYQEQSLGSFSPVFSGCLTPRALIKADASDVLPLDFVQGKKICAFAGICTPETFTETLESLGGTVVRFLGYPDHHPYSDKDISDICEAASLSGADMIVTTEKDGVRLTDFNNFLKELYFLKVEMEMLPSRGEFETELLGRLQ